jgi:hypothetical protein
VDRDAAPRERQGDAAGADPQLEGPAVPCQGRQEVDGRLDRRRVELPRGRLVVRRGDAFVEKAVVVVTAGLYRRGDKLPGGTGATGPVGRG